MDLYSCQIQIFLKFDNIDEWPILQFSYDGEWIVITFSWFIFAFKKIVVLWWLKINIPSEYSLLFHFDKWLRALIILDCIQINQLETNILVNVFFRTVLQIDRGILSGIS